MNIESQIEEKNPRKYCMIDRAAQAKILDESIGQSQHDLARKYDIPRTTLQHWIERKKKLEGKTDPNVVQFFESSSGQAWLHNMCLATFITRVLDKPSVTASAVMGSDLPMTPHYAQAYRPSLHAGLPTFSATAERRTSPLIAVAI